MHHKPTSPHLAGIWGNETLGLRQNPGINEDFDVESSTRISALLWTRIPMGKDQHPRQFRGNPS
jgi:hypothetical protein